ncbi:CheR family methyltransferase [Clostridium tunisiense]|uniref:CheR family methyltransferase n=1 Tax=Clostridium tunisiense TaxID=219748 RepID=UPI0002E1DF47|nr:protein-glutamate O-methyltransferase CheR [Clostridium tunisiense]
MDLKYFEQWVLKEFSIDLSAYKSNQLHRRILTLMSRVGANSVEEYITMLKSSSEQKQKFLDYITINVTEFYRNPEIFKELNNFIKENLAYNKPLKIWSAACSIGAEPYSIAMMLKEISPSVRHRIIATDIDNTILRRAKDGIYLASDIKNVPSYQLDKFFIKKDDKFQIKDEIKEMVTFKKHDLILEGYESNFDIIICRNVVIYFTNEIKEKMYEKFSNSLNKGGLFFIGATESIYNYKKYNFEKLSTFIYKKN